MPRLTQLVSERQQRVLKSHVSIFKPVTPRAITVQGNPNRARSRARPSEDIPHPEIFLTQSDMREVPYMQAPLGDLKKQFLYDATPQAQPTIEIFRHNLPDRLEPHELGRVMCKELQDDCVSEAKARSRQVHQLPRAEVSVMLKKLEDALQNEQETTQRACSQAMGEMQALENSALTVPIRLQIAAGQREPFALIDGLRGILASLKHGSC